MRIAHETGPVDMVILGHFNLALNELTADRLEEALGEAEQGREAARAAGLERRFGQDLAALTADALLRLGRVPRAGEVVREGLALDPAGQGTVYLSITAARLAAIRGDAATADRRISALDLDALDPDVAAYAAAVGAEAYAWAARPGDALAMAEAGLRRLEGLDDVLWSAPLVALGLRAAADQAEAAKVQRGGAGPGELASAEQLRGRLADLAAKVTTSGGRGWVALGQGELARIEGQPGTEAWEAAIEAFDAIPEVLVAAYGRLRAAEGALRSRGLRADVGTLLVDALAAADEAGARPLADALAELAARARIQLTPAGSAVAAAPAAPDDAVGPRHRPSPPPRTRARRRSRSGSRRARWRSSSSSSPGCPTARSRTGCSSRARRRASTSRTSSTSWACRTAWGPR